MSTIDCSTVNNETLTHIVLINQMIATTGCTHEKAQQLLILTDYRLEDAINLFFDERTMPIPCCKFTELITPANTPATPPNFPETLLSFNKLSTSAGTPPPPSSPSTTTTILSSDSHVSSTTTQTLSSSPLNMTMMMMDGTT